MRVLGHPWSINTRKVLMTLAEKGHRADLVLVMVPHGEHKRPEHLALHPFGKVPVLDDDTLVLYETEAINRYLDRALRGPALVPPDPVDAARLAQWVSVADSYFVPHVHPLLVETLFRRYLGGTPESAVIAAGRDGMQRALDVADQRLAESPYLAGAALSLADIHWLPYVDYLVQTGQGAPVLDRSNLRAWWQRVSARPTWQAVARTGPQPYHDGMTADAIVQLHRPNP